jgi:hypothetical protein
MSLEHATLVLAICTAVLAGATFWLVCESKQSSYRQIGVITWLVLESRFDSKEVRAARKKLAQQFDPYDATKHDEVNEKVLELFESIATVYNLRLLNGELADSSFSFYAVGWWEAAAPYILQERRAEGADNSIFGEFESFAQKMRKDYPPFDTEKLRKFLEDEKNLQID